MKIQQKATGRLFDGIMYLWEGDEWKINLRTTKWSRVRYGKNTLNEIDFPWEYDIAGTSVKCIEADETLNYVITTDTEKVVLIQNSAALEVANYDWIDTWICLDGSIKKEIESLELEWEIVIVWEEE